MLDEQRRYSPGESLLSLILQALLVSLAAQGGNNLVGAGLTRNAGDAVAFLKSIVYSCCHLFVSLFGYFMLFLLDLLMC